MRGKKKFAIIHYRNFATRHKTKKAAVTQALVEYIDHLKQEKILRMFGTVDYDPKYDYKKQRRRP